MLAYRVSHDYAANEADHYSPERACSRSGVLNDTNYAQSRERERERARRMDCFRLVSGMKRPRTGSLMIGFMAGLAAPEATIWKKRRPTTECG